MNRILAAGALTLGVLMATGTPNVALAQSSSGATPAPRSFNPRDADEKPNVPPPIPSLPPSRGIAGPRLEAGAVLCRTQEDLQHRAEVGQRISDGVPDAGEPLAGCRILSQARGVEILTRVGLASSQVRLKPSGEVGWTDAYLR
jgi:hypothetical protein